MKKKGVLITIIVLLILLVLAGGAFAYIYFGTDLLKSDKELFAKYITMLGSEENGLVSSIISEYENRKATTAYENSGEFSVNTNITDGALTDSSMQVLQTAINSANNTNITFNGKIDNTNQKIEENIIINYSDSVNLPFTYKQEGDIYGIQADILSPTYIAVENNNLQELFLKLGLTDVTNIPNRFEEQIIESLQFSNEEKSHILNNYIMPIYNDLSEDKFSKAENTDGTTDYTLTLTNEEFKNIFVQILQTLSNDTVMLNKINSIIQETNEGTVDTITSQDIQSIITNINNGSIGEGNVTVTVTEENGAANRIFVSASDTTMEISKNQTNSNVTYIINMIIQNTSSINLELTYTGLDTNKITESITANINISDAMDILYAFNNNITFGNTVNIEALGQDTVVLNDYPEETVQSLVAQIAYIIEQTNTAQMTQIGYPIEFINPMIMWFTAPSLEAYIYNSANETIEGTNLNNEEIEANNSTFENYIGNIRGSQAKSLCDLVDNHNLLDSGDSLINVKLGEPASSTKMTTDINDLEQVKNSIVAGNTYNVTMTYDANTGYICEIGIVEI